MVKGIKQFAPFLLALLLFLVLDLSLAVTPLGESLEMRVENHLAQKFQELESEKRPVDIIAFGTSRTLHGFESNVFERQAPVHVSAYNLGVVSGDYYIFRLMLDQYIKMHGKPRLVILEASDFILNNDRMSDSNLLYLRTMIAHNPAVFQQVLNSRELSWENKFEVVMSNLSATYRYRTLIAPVTLARILLDGPKKKNQLERGWAPFRDKVDADWQNRAEEFSTNRLRKVFGRSNSISSARLVTFLDYCKTMEIPVILVEWPYHQGYEKAFRQLPLNQTYRSELNDTTSRYNTPFLHLSAPQGVDVFGDVDHLSESGASNVTASLSQQLFLLPQVQSLFANYPEK